MRILSLLIMLGTCIITSRSPAQVMGIDRLTIASGTEARITELVAPKHYLRLTVLHTEQDTLRFHFRQQLETRAVAWKDVSRMDVSVGRHSHFWQGLGIGLLTGVAVGALIGSSTASGQDGFTPSANGALGAIAGAMFGSVGGAVLGLAIRTEKWEPVTLPPQNHQ
jgi:hypothetical protein